MPAKRDRGFTFTWFESDDVWIDELRARALAIPHKYCIVGTETCPTTGKIHLQGYIYFAHGKSLKSVRTLMPRAHIEVAVTVGPAIEYCKKEGNFVEDGDPPIDQFAKGKKEIERWNAAWESAKLNELELIPADIRIRQYGNLLKIARDYAYKPESLSGVCGLWLYGLSGAGKSTSVHAQYPDAYLKNASKWWDGYQGEPVAVLDDVDPSHAVWISRYLKIWGDSFPFLGESKGSARYIRPGLFIVTSQFRIEECFTDRETRDAILRRYQVFEKIEGTDLVIKRI